MRLAELPSFGARFSRVSHPLYPGMEFLDCQVVCRCGLAVNLKFRGMTGSPSESSPPERLRVFLKELDRCEFSPREN